MLGTEQGPGQGCRPAVQPIYCSLDQCGCFSSPGGSEDSRVLPKIYSHRVTQANISSEKRWTVAHVSFLSESGSHFRAARKESRCSLESEVHCPENGFISFLIKRILERLSSRWRNGQSWMDV